MTKADLEKAVELLTSECAATFEYSLGWDCKMFHTPIRLAVSNTIKELDDQDPFIKDVLLKLSYDEVVD